LFTWFLFQAKNTCLFDFSIEYNCTKITIVQIVYISLDIILTPLSNISVISWQSVLLVEESRVQEENYRYALRLDKFNHIKLFWVHLATGRNWTHNFSGETCWMYSTPYYHKTYWSCTTVECRTPWTEP
jgi:hypothetical protein